jgi:hypothetical protein
LKKLKIVVLNRKERAFVKNESLTNLLESLKKKIDIDDLWILMDSGKGKLEYQNQPQIFNYKFFEEYKTNNILKIIDLEKPDIILMPNDFEYMERAFLYAAKLRKIPIVLSLQQGVVETVLVKDNSLIRNRFSIISSRGIFIIKKYIIFLKTLQKVGIKIPEVFKIIIDDLITPFQASEPAGKYGCDLILVANEKMKRGVERRNKKSQIVITGDPSMDSLYKEIIELKNRKRQSSKTKIVLMTTGMLEHGLWTYKMWKETIIQTIKTVNDQFGNEIEFLIKIHPATERISEYEELINELGIKVPIIQSEKLSKVLSDSDIVITYGDSWGTLEAIILDKPVIVVNLFNYPIEKMPFLKEGIIFELKDMGKLKSLILEIQNEKRNQKKVDDFIRKIIFKMDGKSGERSADAIFDLIKEKI